MTSVLSSWGQHFLEMFTYFVRRMGESEQLQSARTSLPPKRLSLRIRSAAAFLKQERRAADSGRDCRGTPINSTSIPDTTKTAHMSMRRTSHGLPYREKHGHRQSSGEWRIGVGDTHEQPRMTERPGTKHTAETTEAKLSTHWLDLFRSRYQAWSSSCRSSIGDFLTFATSHAETERPATHEDAGLEKQLAEKLRATSRKKPTASHSRTTSIGRSIPPSSKAVYFIRHGTAYCNVCRFPDWLEDQRLTPRGWAQVAALRLHLQSIPFPQVSTLLPLAHFVEASDAQIVFTSTLSRAMETAAGAFGAPRSLSTSSTDGASLLMTPQDAIYNLQCATRGVLKLEGTPPIVAHEDCRERLGDGVVPNKRRTLADAKRQFPGIDFSLVPCERDLPYERFDRPDGETDIDISTRAMRLKRFLLERPESRIAVVSHGHFLSALLKLYLGGEEFSNAELRVYEVGEAGCKTARRDLWFDPRTARGMFS